MTRIPLRAFLDRQFGLYQGIVQRIGLRMD
jgi:hypothetical protein